MGRNRKNGSATWLVPGAKAALICLLLGGSAIGYVYQKNQLVELGRQIQRKEQELKGLQAGNARLQSSMLTLQSPVYLENRVRELRLPLMTPAQSQILTIVEMPAGSTMLAPRNRPAPKSDSLFAENQLGRPRRQ
jgi:cell division protein FtsB